MTSGETITRDSLMIRRPGLGLSPNLLNQLVGKILKNDVMKYSPVMLDSLLDPSIH